MPIEKTSAEADLSNKQLVMVCGAARSGTTMLDLIIGNSSDAFSTGEVFAVYRPYRIHHKSPVCSCGDSDCPVWAGLLDVPDDAFHSHIFSRRPEINLVVDSSKDLRWVLDSNIAAHKAGLAVTNVVIWKNPIELSYSYWRRGQKVDWYRKEFIRYYGRLLDLKLPFITVNYKDLVTEPDEIVGRLCDRLGITFDEERMKFWEKRHHHFFGSAGTRGQVGSKQGALSYKSDYPEDFLKLFAEEEQHTMSDPLFSRIVGELQRRDVRQEYEQRSSEFLTARRPVWYFRHVLKAFWWKYFPQRSPVVE